MPASPPEAITGMEADARKLGRGWEIEALQHAVAIDVGIDDGGDAGILEAARQIDGVKLARLRPALDGNLAATRIDADDDPVREFSACLPHQRLGS